MPEMSKRDLILNSAFEIFRTKGFHNAKIEEIAKNAGIGKGTVYEYFSGKKEIFEESFIRNVEMGLQEVHEIFVSELSFKEKLAKFLKYKYNIITVHTSLAEVFFAQGDLISKRVKDVFLKNMGKHTLDVIRLIEQGIDEGLIRKTVDKEILCSCIMGLSNHYIGMVMFKAGGKEPDYGYIVDQVLEGFGEKEDCNEN
ncbi:transcriptional regulator, TetR family [Dethiosulfatibacter aminovorans DSM 17477]|uniref:Transcriptional regulator, TetR family n=1 Tax=Dethiosulfatibacter aminovorans DSM 17477 TaxID=1121476 RepID=A0A1M6CAJ6_9FIRM|nr:TetR/AcrR family transcriptional regulator [Dethiosulfatibacter aminovorans]SHI58029.1 transcriptional regulator, TetR family [Dethiosulfatibacter aminovorans DSM 17477]